jgi:hypothetical protein
MPNQHRPTPPIPIVDAGVADAGGPQPPADANAADTPPDAGSDDATSADARDGADQ